MIVVEPVPPPVEVIAEDPKDPPDDEAVLLSRLLSVTKAARTKLVTRSKSFSSSTALRLDFSKLRSVWTLGHQLVMKVMSSAIIWTLSEV